MKFTETDTGDEYFSFILNIFFFYFLIVFSNLYRLDVLSCKRLLAFRRIATKFDAENKIVRNLL